MIQYGNRLTSMTLKYGPDPSASARDAVNLLSVDNTSTRSYFRCTRMSLMVFSWVSTRLRFGLSLMKPLTCCENAETFSSSALTAWVRSLTAANSVFAFTSNELICSLRLPSTPAILFALASSCLMSSSRLPMVSEKRATPSSAALRCGDV